MLQFMTEEDVDGESVADEFMSSYLDNSEDYEDSFLREVEKIDRGLIVKKSTR